MSVYCHVCDTYLESIAAFSACSMFSVHSMEPLIWDSELRTPLWDIAYCPGYIEMCTKLPLK